MPASTLTRELLAPNIRCAGGIIRPQHAVVFIMFVCFVIGSSAGCRQRYASLLRERAFACVTPAAINIGLNIAVPTDN